MPLLVEPSPSLPAARLGAPDEAQEASYLAASDSTRNFCCSFSSMTVYLCLRGKSGGRRINDRRCGISAVIARRRRFSAQLLAGAVMSAAVLYRRRAGGWRRARRNPYARD